MTSFRCLLSLHSWLKTSYAVRLDADKVDARTAYLCRRCLKTMTFGEWYWLPVEAETRET